LKLNLANLANIFKAYLANLANLANPFKVYLAIIMDSIFWTLMIFLIAAGVDGIKVLVSIPEGELTENATKQETKILERELKSMKVEIHESIAKLERELQSIKALLKETSGSASKTEQKSKLDATPEPNSKPDSTPEPEPEPKQVLLPYQGSAGATTTGGQWIPLYAFSQTSAVWNSDGKSLPQWVWFNFSKPHRLAKIGFPSHVNEQFPKKFQVVGSSDCASWTVMLRVEISDGTKEFKSWEIPEENRTPFRCIGLKVEKCWERQAKKYIELHKVQMWEEK